MMKIEGLLSDGKKLLNDIQPGEVFVIGESAYLVTERRIDTDSSMVPCVNLSTGKVSGFSSHRDVKTADCTLVFK